MAAEQLQGDVLQTIPLSRIVVGDDFNPRLAADDRELQELAASIRERGLLQPIRVAPTADGEFRVIAGERRYRAAALAALPQAPAIVRQGPAGEAEEDRAAEQLVDAVVENRVRANLNALEEALACRRLKVEHGRTIKGIAQSLRMTQALVRERLAILDLPEQLWPLVGAGTIPLKAAAMLVALGRALAQLPRLHTGTRRRRTLPDLRRRGDGARERPRLNAVPRRSVRTARIGLAPRRSAHANRHSSHRREAILGRGWERLPLHRGLLGRSSEIPMIQRRRLLNETVRAGLLERNGTSPDFARPHGRSCVWNATRWRCTSGCSKHPDARRITVPLFVSYLSWLTMGVAAGFLVVATAAFSPPAVTTLAFAIGIGTLLVSSAVAYCGRSHVVSVYSAGLVVLISAWTIVASLVFAQSTVQHIALGGSLAIGALSVIGLTAHELSLERAALSAKDESTEREARLAAAA